MKLARPDLARGTQQFEPNGARAREGDRVHAGVAGERSANLAQPGEKCQRAGGHACVAKRAHEGQGAGRALLRRLEDHGVAGGQRGGDHPTRDRDREVPRRDDRHHPAGPIAQRVALTGKLSELAPLGQGYRSARVVLEKVDGLAHVGVGLRPGLGALAHLQRGQARPIGAQDRRGAREDRRPLGGRRPRPRRRRGGHRHHCLINLGLAGHRRVGDGPVGVPRVQRDQLAIGTLVITDQHGDRQGQALVQPREGVEQFATSRSTTQLDVRLVDEGAAHGARSSASRSPSPAWATRKESLELFSSRRRTR